MVIKIKIGKLDVYGVIYKITNKVNNKVYIGQTTKPFNMRYCRKGDGIERVYRYHKSLKTGTNLHLINSIEKHGFESFDINEVLDIAFSRKELNIKEQLYIKKYNTYKNGYNNNLGGEGNQGYEGMKGSDNPMARAIVQMDLDGKFIKEWGSVSEAGKYIGVTPSKIVSVCKGYYGRKASGGFLWAYKDEYAQDKKYEYINECGLYLTKNIAQLSLDGEYIKTYSSSQEVKKYYPNANPSKIIKCCDKKQKTHIDYVWMYEVDYDKNGFKQLKRQSNGKPKPVLQYDLNGNFIKEYESCAYAGKILKLSATSLNRCCQGNRNTAYGYVWKYKNEEERINTP